MSTNCSRGKKGCLTNPYLQVWRHSVTVVGLIKYPLQMQQVICGLKSFTKCFLCVAICGTSRQNKVIRLETVDLEGKRFGITGAEVLLAAAGLLPALEQDLDSQEVTMLNPIFFLELDIFQPWNKQTKETNKFQEMGDTYQGGISYASPLPFPAH